VIDKNTGGTNAVVKDGRDMTDLHSADPELLAGLMAGRAAVEGYMSRRETQGHSWDEVTATQQLCMAASPPIVYAEFTGTQEEVVGAYWLWWWIDTTGEAFGMLVQAKKLHRAPTGTKWWVDFGYKRGTRSQITALLAASDHLNLPAGYMIYGGDTAYRSRTPPTTLLAFCTARPAYAGTAVRTGCRCWTPGAQVAGPRGQGIVVVRL
jgi:hypothetical protein